MNVRRKLDQHICVISTFLCLFAAIGKFSVNAQSGVGDGYPYDLVFVANLDPPGIFVAHPDTLNFTLIPGFADLNHVQRPVAIDYDPVDGMVYWTDVQHSSISRAFLDGTGSVVLLRNLDRPDGLTLDLENRVMYWTDTGSDLIERATMDGQDRAVVLNLTSPTQDAVEPRAIIVDPTNSHLYWTDWGSEPKIERANTDGSSRMVLVNTGLQWPNGLALDLQGGKIYWCDAGLDLIESTDLLGQNRRVYADLTSYNIHPFDVGFYRGDLYWTDWRFYKLVKLTFQPSTDVALVGTASFPRAGGLHMHNDTFADHSCVDLMPCGDGERCRQFDASHQCVCQDGPVGANCTLYNPCNLAVCRNGGSCFRSASVNDGYFCQCPNRYSGTNCEIFDDPCNSGPCTNGGTCLGSSEGFSCTCTSEFIGSSCEAESHPYDLVFVANLEPPGIFVAPADTFNFTLIPGFDNHTSVSRPVAIDYDPLHRMVYWTDVELSTLSRAFLDGTGVEVLFTNLQAPDGLTLDLQNRVMYWTDTGTDLIERATMDGQDRAVVLNLTDPSRGVVQPRSIVVDPSNSTLYWTDWGNNPRIERSRTDGSGRQTLISTGLQLPNGLALDLQDGKLYWCDAGMDRIESSDLFGRGRTIIIDLVSFGIHPFDVVVYYDYIYWTDWAATSILRVDSLGNLATNHGSSSFAKGVGIHIYKGDVCQQRPCQNGGTCVISAQNPSSYVCACVNGFSGSDCQNDIAPPTFITGCPSDINRLVDINVESVPVSWPEVTASDPSLPLLWNISHPSGDFFTTGDEAMVTYMVTDQQGNSAYCYFVVRVTGVGLDCPSDVTAVTGPGIATANVPWTLPNVTFSGAQREVTFYVGSPPTAGTGDADTQVHVYSDYQSGNTFNIGATPITYYVQGLITECLFHVIVEDPEPPKITGCPDNVIIPVTSSSNLAPHSWSPPVITDNSGSVNVNFGCQATALACNQAGSGIFAVRVTMVTYSATDNSGNPNMCAFTVTVTVVDLVCPANVSALTTPGSNGARVNWTKPVLTGWDGPTNFTSSAQPGDLFPIGRHQVSYRQWFAVYGVVLHCSFSVDVVVVDTEPPQISGCPDDIIIPVTSSSEQVTQNWSPPVITDNSGSANVNFGCPATVLECNQAGSGIFAVGVTMVTYSATDNSGNTNMCAFTVTVTVVDLVCPADIRHLATPGSTRSSVNWPEPVITGWDGPTNITSSAQPGAVFEIGRYQVNYLQWFAANGVVLRCSFLLEVVGLCASNYTQDPLLGILNWPDTVRGSTAKSVERCRLTTLNAGEPLAVRNCSIVASPVYFRWESHKPRSCGDDDNDIDLERVVNVTVSVGNAAEVAEFLANETSKTSDQPEDIEAISTILGNIVNAGSGDTQVTELVLETVNNVINSVAGETTPDSPAPDIDAGSSSAIIQSVETQVSLTLQQEGHVSIREDSIHVEAVSLDPEEASGGLSFVSVSVSSQEGTEAGTLAGTEIKTITNTSEIPKDVVASIRLPANIVQLLQSGNGNSSKPLRASFIVYADDTLFQSAQIRNFSGEDGSRIEVAGSVVSLTVEDIELVNLTEPVVIEFKAPDINATERNRTAIQCVFWDFDLNDEVGDWSTVGCKLAASTNATVSCNCSHATNFAILVSVQGHRGIPPELRKALDIISLVGCVLSILLLTITLIIYLAFKKLRNGKSRQIFIHFCFSLLLLYVVFVTGVDNAKGSNGGCVFVAALLHYLTLSTMLWMAVEARNMYVSTVKVFPEDQSWYMVKACLFAWGSPVLVLIITLAAATDHYNVIVVDHNTGIDLSYCFLRPDLVLYLGLLLPIGLILIHNIITFILVMRSLLKVKEASRSQQISKRLQNAVGISALIGLTWCFGFLAIEGAAFAFQLIFCLANSFQGFFVFAMFCYRREEVRTILAPYLRRLCCGRDWRSLFPSMPKQNTFDLPLVSESVPSSPTSVRTTNFDLSLSESNKFQ